MLNCNLTSQWSNDKHHGSICHSPLQTGRTLHSTLLPGNFWMISFGVLQIMIRLFHILGHQFYKCNRIWKGTFRQVPDISLMSRLTYNVFRSCCMVMINCKRTFPIIGKQIDNTAFVYKKYCMSLSGPCVYECQMTRLLWETYLVQNAPLSLSPYLFEGGVVRVCVYAWSMGWRDAWLIVHYRLIFFVSSCIVYTLTFSGVNITWADWYTLVEALGVVTGVYRSHFVKCITGVCRGLLSQRLISISVAMRGEPTLEVILALIKEILATGCLRKQSC